MSSIPRLLAEPFCFSWPLPTLPPPPPSHLCTLVHSSHKTFCFAWSLVLSSSCSEEAGLGYFVQVTDRNSSVSGRSSYFELLEARSTSSSVAVPEYQDETGGTGVGDMSLALLIVAGICGEHSSRGTPRWCHTPLRRSVRAGACISWSRGLFRTIHVSQNQRPSHAVTCFSQHKHSILMLITTSLCIRASSGRRQTSLLHPHGKFFPRVPNTYWQPVGLKRSCYAPRQRRPLLNVLTAYLSFFFLSPQAPRGGSTPSACSWALIPPAAGGGKHPSERPPPAGIVDSGP